MCGIAGLLSYKKPIDAGHIRLMIQALVHRGPDDEGVYVSSGSLIPSVGLGSRRLSIIDLFSGHQPIHNEDKKIWIVYNGEIYNFQELRTRLINKGHNFYTSTDTEVIIHLYEDYGDNCVAYLNGMFSFAIWDDNQKKIFIARDRLGEKPLYYCWDGSTLIFASELKGILTYSEFRRAVDIKALVNYLQYGYVPDPLSIFEGVFKLPPGHILTVINSKLRVEKYWNLEFKANKAKSEEEIEEELLERLKVSVRMRLISDVPLGAFSSGGIDSSAIVALMAGEMNQPVKTFSIGFKEPDYNELPFARITAKHFGTEHHEAIVGQESFSLVEKIVRYFDEPFGDASCIPTYYVSQLASKYVKVVLSGDGGDELFAGYDSYAVILKRTKYERLPSFVRAAMRILSQNLPSGFYGKNLLYNISLPTDLRYIDYISAISSARHYRLLSDDFKERMGIGKDIFQGYFDECSSLDPLSRLQYVDLKTYLPADILVKVDRMSMANSLEVRVPLLDHTVVEFVNSIPWQYKKRDSIRKYILKKVAKKILPKEIIERKKHGFAVPLEYWFKDELKEYVHQILFEPRTLQRGYFNRNYLQYIVKEYERGRRDHSGILWNLLILEVWHRLYMDR